MLISLSWLGSLLRAPDGAPPHLDAAEVARALTSLGLEVERLQRVGEGLETVVVAQVLSRAPHPSADRLQVVQVDDGRGPVQVVCGAANVPDPGGLVLFARVGTVLPGGLTIGAREIRGVPSSGMLCAEDELDIGPDDTGIVVLSPAPVGSALAPGTPLPFAIPGVADTLIELSVTPNRPDALGHVGVARDLALRLGLAFAPPEAALPTAVDAPDLVTLADTAGCGRYIGVALEGLEVAPSPLWLRVRLHRVGLRPISNVVDVTNFVLMEWGQPLHAFDRDALAEGRVVVRRAQAGEQLVALDGRELALTSDDLVIADAQAPAALAGVMGGAASGTTSATTRGLLEAAWFRPGLVRRSSRAHGLHTDSSHRFERGVDHGPGLLAAAARAVALLQVVAGARVVAVAQHDGERPEAAPIRLRAARVTLLLGMEIPAAAVERILAGLGVVAERLASAPGAASEWRCTPPSHRPDLTIEEDLIEELMRHHGLDALPAVPARPSDIPPPRPLRTRAALHDRLVDGLVGRGLHEIVGYAFTGADKLALLDPADPPASEATWVRVTNPMRGPMAVMRTHMLPALLDAALINSGRHPRALALFECGRTYRWVQPVEATGAGGDGPTAAVDRSLPCESPRLATLRAASRDAPEPPAALARTVGLDLLHALRRAGIEADVTGLGTNAAATGGADGSDRAPAWLHPGCAAALRLRSGAIVGVFGEVHPRVRSGWGWPDERAVAYGELHLDALPLPGVAAMSPLPRFPGSARDISIEVDESVTVDRLVAALVEAGAQLPAADPTAPELVAPDAMARAVEWIEDYRGEGVPSGCKATLLRLHYRASGGSVTDEGVQALHERVVDRALAQLAAAGLVVRRR